MPPMPAPTPRAPAGQTEWVGVSTAAGTPAATPPQAQPQPQPYAQQPYPSVPPAPTSNNSSALKWVIGVVALVGAITAYHLSGGGKDEPPPQPAPRERPAPQPPQAGPAPPQGQPPQGQPPQGQPPQGRQPPPQQGGLPTVVSPDSGQLPTLRSQDGGQAWVFEFLVPTGQQPLRVLVAVSKQGWSAGLMAVATMGAQEPESISTPGPFQLNRQGNDVFRVLQPQWQRDGLNIGGACVVFAASGVQDVPLQNSKLCVLSDNCQRIVGCGVVQ